MVGLPGLEPGTSSLSVTRSNQLSYKPSPEQRYFTENSYRKANLSRRLSTICQIIGSSGVRISGLAYIDCGLWSLAANLRDSLYREARNLN
jgi:hypothetical protein